MKKFFIIAMLCFLGFVLGIGINNIAISQAETPKIAYVNIAKLLDASKTLKLAEDTKIKETQNMLKWYKTVGEEIDKQTNEANKKTLIQKYEAELIAKRKAIQDEYTKKISMIDKQLGTVIAEKARKLNYDYVFKKDSMLYGGTDITNEIIPLVK